MTHMFTSDFKQCLFYGVKMFSEKVVLITGSSQGIGAETAIHFAKRGASVVITGRNSEKLNNVARKVEEVGKKPLVVVGDICDEKFANILLQSTITQLNRLDVLVNNAGLGSNGGLQDVDVSLKEYEKIFDINVKAVYRLTKLAVPYLIETKGNIVNISSVSGIRPFQLSIDYSMSKAALEQFTRYLALELASKQVRVNIVAPGPVMTYFRQNCGFTDAETQERYDLVTPKVPLKRVATVDEISPAIVFLASEEASYITGVSLPVDGGIQLA